MTFFLFITANVGSIFEDPKGLLKLWIKEFLKTIEKLKPKFIGLHCQEFGGKNYETSMVCVDEFVRTLLSSEELIDFENIRVFLDEDFSSNDKFTALGSLYFIHKDCVAHIWNFIDHKFVPVTGKEVHSGNIEDVPIKFKLKFPQEFFPECKWSRKGFMKTRWLINGIVFDMINIHLFHDESNFVSISEFPSPYAKNRRNALEYTLKFNQNDNFENLPVFIFGDFNFRLDTNEVINELTNNSQPSRVKSLNGDLMKLIYHDNVNEKLLALERKHFYYSDHNFFNNRLNIPWLLQRDKELLYFDSMIAELKIDFPPSYPFSEEITLSSKYMNTRCPSWCDRVIMNIHAKRLIDESNFKAKYQLMGHDVPMGDHKPVYLYFEFTAPKENVLLNESIGSKWENETKSVIPLNSVRNQHTICEQNSDDCLNLLQSSQMLKSNIILSETFSNSTPHTGESLHTSSSNYLKLKDQNCLTIEKDCDNFNNQSLQIDHCENILIGGGKPTICAGNHAFDINNLSTLQRANSAVNNFNHVPTEKKNNDSTKNSVKSSVIITTDELTKMKHTPDDYEPKQISKSPFRNYKRYLFCCIL